MMWGEGVGVRRNSVSYIALSTEKYKRYINIFIIIIFYY